MSQAVLAIDLAAARRIAVDRQRFASRPRRATVAEIESTIERLGCVQIDSVTAVDRAHRLTLASRLGRLPADGINELRRRGRVFEYWAHEACLLPVSEWPFFARVQRARLHPWWGPVLAEHPALAARILADVEAGGPSSARAYGGAGQGYWQWTPAKRVFEALWTAGELVVAERRGFERLYDLPHRVLPAAVLAAPPVDEAAALRHFVRRTVRARGIVTRAGLADYYRLKGGRSRLREPVAELLDATDLVACRVGDHEALCDHAAAELAAAPPEPATPLLLCPFDNLIWDRAETLRLFNFAHVLEIYKRPPERVHGYYVLPLLAGDRILGRVDLRADRRTGVLRVLQTTWERRPAPRALERALARLGHALALTPVVEGRGA